MKKKCYFGLLIMLLFTSCSKKELDMRVQLVDGVIEYLEGKGYSCDTSFNDITNYKYITISQKELFLHFFPEQKNAYENAVNEILKANNAKEGEGDVYLQLNEFNPIFPKNTQNLVDEIKEYIVEFTSLIPNKSFPNPEVYGYIWAYDSLQCEISICSIFSCCDNVSIDVALTNDLRDEVDNGEYETTSQDPCVLLLKRLYEDYVLYDEINESREVEPFENLVDEMFTKKGKQKLIDACDYELEPGEVCYALWEMRTGAQDYSDEDVAQVGIKEILPLGNNKYLVKLFDQGFESETLITFAEENGKLKIDDFKSDQNVVR